MREFIWPVRVYYEDTDAAGVVYHSNYLKFMERARTEWLRACGYSLERLEKQQGIVFVVAGMNVKFIRPARFDELLNVQSSVTGIDGAKLTFRQSILDRSESLKCDAEVFIVCIDSKSFKPRRIPDPIRAELTDDN